MLKALIAIDPDLPSKMAIRYAGQLKTECKIGVHLLHIAEPGENRETVGTGWVQQTWENSVIQDSKRKISRLVQTERKLGLALGNPQILAGDRERHLLHEISFSGYDLLIEGFFHAFLPDTFQKKIRSSLYQNAPCAILAVKNLVPLSKGVLIIAEDNRVDKKLAMFLNLFEKSSIAPDILICRLDQPDGNKEVTQPLSFISKKIEDFFSGHGKSCRSINIIQGDVDTVLPYVRDYGLVLAGLPRPESRLETLLSQSPCPIFFCR